MWEEDLLKEQAAPHRMASSAVLGERQEAEAPLSSLAHQQAGMDSRGAGPRDALSTRVLNMLDRRAACSCGTGIYSALCKRVLTP